MRFNLNEEFRRQEEEKVRKHHEYLESQKVDPTFVPINIADMIRQAEENGEYDDDELSDDEQDETDESNESDESGKSDSE